MTIEIKLKGAVRYTLNWIASSVAMQEREMQYLEEHIPALAQSAVTQAYWQSLAAGYSVLESEDGIIYERFPDGSSKMVKTIEPPTPIAIGARRQLL
jgi:hypothetical protein